MVTFFMNFGIVRYGYGETGLAAYLIIGYLMLIILTLFLGMAEGLQPAFSYLSAAKENDKLLKLLKLSAAVFALTGLLCYIFVLSSSMQFYSIFTPDELYLADFAAKRSAAYFCAFVCAGLNILMISYYQATLSTARSMVLSSLRGFILPFLLIVSVPAFFGYDALWLCHSLAEALTLMTGAIIILKSK